MMTGRSRCRGLGLVALIAGCSGDVTTVNEGGSGESAESSSSGTEEANTDETAEAEEANTGETEQSDSDDPAPGICDPEHDALAPPSVELDIGPATPIDIEHTEVQLTFDFAPELISASASMEFRVSPEGGMPIFDLAPALEIDEARLDGVVVPIEDLAHHPLHDDDAANSDMRVLERALEPCTLHTLELSYAITAGDTSFGWNPNLAVWSSLPPPPDPLGGGGQQLELWAPANLRFDRHALELRLDASDTSIELELISNADSAEQVEPAVWELHWSETDTATPLVVLDQAVEVTPLFGPHETPSGQLIELEYYARNDLDDQWQALLDTSFALLDTYSERYGPYPGSRLSGYLSPFGLDCDFPGAIHGRELHEGIARQWSLHGLRPLRHDDAWFGLAWGLLSNPDYVVDNPLDWADNPRVLHDDRPYARSLTTSDDREGARVFWLLFDEVGRETIEQAMDSFIAAHLGGPTTSAELELHLYCETASPAVFNAFHRFVHGEADVASPPPLDDCP